MGAGSRKWRWARLAPPLLGFALGLASSFLLFTPLQYELSGKGANATRPAPPMRPTELGPHVHAIQKAERELAVRLHASTRLLCWVMHDPRNWQARAAIVQTWGRRCQILLFMTGKAAPLEPPKTHGVKGKPAPTPANVTIPEHGHRLAPNAFFIRLKMDEHYNKLWQKTRLAFEYVGAHYAAAFDWVLKIDDDSFVVVENLRLFLLSTDPKTAAYYGCPYKSMGGYNSGGPGYVMSSVTFAKLQRALKGGRGCAAETAKVPEDIEMAKCLKSVGVTRGDTRDSGGRFRFSPFEPIQTMHHNLLPKGVKWFWTFTQYKLADGPACCSDTFISFHYIKPDLMLTLEFLIYGLHPFSRRDIWTAYPGPTPPPPDTPPPGKAN